MNVSAFEPYFVLIVIGIAFFLIYRNLLRPSVSLLIAVIVFVVTGILTPDDVLAGFANDKIASILLLILLAAGIRKNFNIELWFNRLFQKATTYKKFLFQMMAQSAIVSSMINNAPVVALLTPYVVEWGKKHRISPSKLLIPLSFATIMGGMLTIIGTSTTLLLNGFLTSNKVENIQSGDLLILGSLVVITGILFFMVAGHKLLPNNPDLFDTFESNKEDFLVEAAVTSGSSLIGKTINQASLRHLKGGYLVEIVREDQTIRPVEPNDMIKEKDSLIFAGERNAILEFIEEKDGLELPEQVSEFNKNGNPMAECIINVRSSLIGKKVKDSDFRQRYDASIVAMQRDGERVQGKIGEIKIAPGDLLLVFTGKSFYERVDLYRDIHVISEQHKSNSSGGRLAMAMGTIAVAIIFLFIYGQLSLFPSLLIIFSIMVAYGLFSASDIKRELDLHLVAILVFSLAMGNAMINTGAGTMVAEFIVTLLEPYGKVGIMVGLILITVILTSIIGNVGAVSISFPLAYAMSASLDTIGHPFYLALAFGASAAFLTPISYQTNLIIFGPGGYTFKDFFKVGLPVTILYLTVATLGIIYLYKDHLLLN
jgi:di/tricarboxylate transporter